MSREWMPGATKMPLPEADKQGSYTKTQLVYHSTGTKAGARGNHSYFSGVKVAVESTFLVDYDGEIVQIMPATARADANGSANRRAISVEVVGLGSEAFTAKQLESCIAIAKWACTEHPIGRRVIPSESASGIGWHVMFGAPGPWTTVRGKVCPGDKRIAQVKESVIPAVQRFQASLVAAAVPLIVEDTMQTRRVKRATDNRQYLIAPGLALYMDGPTLAGYLALGLVPPTIEVLPDDQVDGLLAAGGLVEK